MDVNGRVVGVGEDLAPTCYGEMSDGGNEAALATCLYDMV